MACRTTFQVGKGRYKSVGCGWGTDSILCGLLGAEVVGIDLSKERLEIANKRLEFYRKSQNKEIRVNFLLENTLKHTGEYDVIWSKESVSHIDPLDKFLQTSYQNLTDNGKLIISDTHALNPLARFRAWKEHLRVGVYTTREDPKDGQCISYAQERLFSVIEMKKALQKSGFEVQSVHLGIFLPSFFFNKYTFTFSKSLEFILGKVPVINLIAGVYTIVSIKRR